jgi:hypothetical protein
MRGAPLERAPWHHSVRAYPGVSRRSYAAAVQRLFSMFPGGAAGVGLLVLRLCCASAILTTAFSRGLSVAPSWTAVGLAVLALLMAAGALTPLACAVGALVEASDFLHGGHGMDLRFVVFALLVTVALGLLGPGAFSVDAKLFGRRRIISNVD